MFSIFLLTSSSFDISYSANFLFFLTKRASKEPEAETISQKELLRIVQAQEREERRKEREKRLESRASRREMSFESEEDSPQEYEKSPEEERRQSSGRKRERPHEDDTSRETISSSLRSSAKNRPSRSRETVSEKKDIRSPVPKVFFFSPSISYSTKENFAFNWISEPACSSTKLPTSFKEEER